MRSGGLEQIAGIGVHRNMKPELVSVHHIPYSQGTEMRAVTKEHVVKELKAG